MDTMLVTGGAGFIGSNFVRHALDHTDARVVVLDKLTYAGSLRNLFDVERDPRYAFVRGDIADREAVEAVFDGHRPTFVVNFAAESHVDRSIDSPREFIRTNAVGTFELLEASRILRVPESDVVPRIGKLVEENEIIRKELETIKSRMLSERTGDIMENVKKLNGLNVLSVEIPDAGPDQLRKVWDDVRNKLSSGIAVLGARDDGKAYLLVGVTSDLQKKYHSGNIVKELAPLIGGKGGGRPDMAQAGGKEPAKLPEALQIAKDTIRKMLGA